MILVRRELIVRVLIKNKERNGICCEWKSVDGIVISGIM